MRKKLPTLSREFIISGKDSERFEKEMRKTDDMISDLQKAETMSDTPTGVTDKELRIHLKKKIIKFGDGKLEFETKEIEQLLHCIERLEHAPPSLPATGAREAFDIVKGLADWSNKFPRDRTYHLARKSEMDGELIYLENKAKDLLQNNPLGQHKGKESGEDELYCWGCDVYECGENRSVNGGGCWRDTGYWMVCSKHYQDFRDGKPQPQMKQSSIDREATRSKDGFLPPTK